MDIKELADKYRKEIPFDQSDELLFLKSLYIKLGRDRVFDEKYYFGNMGTMKKIYELARRSRHNTKDIIDKREIICYSLSYIIRDLLKEFGYECFVTDSLNNGDHVFPVVKLRSGESIKYDLQRDLENIQTNRKTKFFGTTEQYDDYVLSLSKIPDEKQLEIDLSIGYVNSPEDYKDCAIERLKTRLSAIDGTPEKLHTILSDREVTRLAPNIGYVECYRFYKKILNVCLDEKEKNRVYIIACSKNGDTETQNEKENTNCIFADIPNNPTIYIFSRVHNKYAYITLEKLSELQEQGLEIGISDRIKGVKLLKKTIERHTKQKREIIGKDTHD